MLEQRWVSPKGDTQRCEHAGAGAYACAYMQVALWGPPAWAFRARRPGRNLKSHWLQPVDLPRPHARARACWRGKSDQYWAFKNSRWVPPTSMFFVQYWWDFYEMGPHFGGIHPQITAAAWI